MAATPKVYVICDQNCKFEGMTKEQILTAIAQAVETGTIGDLDTGFITTIKTINGTPLKFFVGEQATYDALTDEEKTNLFAIITNDTTKAGLLQDIEDLKTAVKELQEGINAPLVATVDIVGGKGTSPSLKTKTAYLVILQLSSKVCSGIFTPIFSDTQAQVCEIGAYTMNINTDMGITFSDDGALLDADGTLTFYKIGGLG